MQFDLHVNLAAQRLVNAGYRVEVRLARDKLHAWIKGRELVRMRIKNACVPEHKIWQAEQGADMLRLAGVI